MHFDSAADHDPYLALIAHVPLAQVLALVVSRDEVRRMAADVSDICYPSLRVASSGALATKPCASTERQTKAPSAVHRRLAVLELVADSEEIAC